MDEKQQIIEKVIQSLWDNGYIPFGSALKQLGVSEYKIQKYFGNWHNLANAIDPSIVQQAKEQRAINELRKILEPSNLGYNLFKKKKGKISYIRAAFNTWDQAIEAAFDENTVKSWKKTRYKGNSNISKYAKEYVRKKRPLLSEAELIKKMEEYYFSHNKEINSIGFSQRKTDIIKAISKYGGWKQLIKKSAIWQCEKEKVLDRFKQEASEIIQEYGYFSMRLHKAKLGNLHHTKLRDMFGSLIQLRIEAGLDVPPEAYNEYHGAYTAQEYSDFLWGIYNKYGFISHSLIHNEPNHIQVKCIVKHFGTIEAACKHFGVPYKAPAHRSKFYFEIETKACNYLQTPCIQEKTWPWLKYKSRLRCDLFFPLLNLVIEVDGPQHYKNYRFFHETDSAYYTALKRDQIKNEELPKHGIDLVRIDSRNIRRIEEILKPYKEKLNLIYDLCAF